MRAVVGAFFIVVALTAGALAQTGMRDRLAAAQAALRETEARVPADDTRLLAPLIELARAYRQNGRYAEAVSAMRRMVAIREARQGASHRSFPGNLTELGNMLLDSNRGTEALPVLRRAAQLAAEGGDEGLGPQGIVTAAALGALGRAQQLLGRPREAQGAFERERSIRLAELRAASGDRARSASAHRMLAWTEYRLANRQAARDAIGRAVAIREAIRGTAPADLVEWLTDAAQIAVLVDPAAAEAYARRAVTAAERARGAGDPAVALALGRLGEALRVQGRFADAEVALRRALTLRERAFGPAHQSAGVALGDLGMVLTERGDYAGAEGVLQRAVAILERQLGAESGALVRVLAGLAHNYLRAGRARDGEPLVRRALAIQERNVGADSPLMVGVLSDVGLNLAFQGRLEEALPHFTRAIALADRAGVETTQLATLLLNHADALRRLGRHAEAEAPAARGHEMRRRLLGADSPRTLAAAWTRARLLAARGNHADAERGLREVLAVYERSFGPHYASLAWVHHDIALALRAQGRFREAFAELREAAAIVARRVAGQGDERDDDDTAERLGYRSITIDFVALAATVRAEAPVEFPDALAEAFAFAQLGQSGATTVALARMADRFSAADPALGALLRARTDLGNRIAAREAELRAAIGAGRREIAERHRQALAAAQRELTENDRRIAREHPGYQRLIGAASVPLADMQRVLAPDEALLDYVVGGTATYLFVLRRGRAELLRLPLGAARIAEDVRRLRAGVDSLGADSVAALPRFDLARAHAMYRALFEPALPLLDGVRQVFVVPDRALQSIPFSLLVAAPPPAHDPANPFGAYRRSEWLVRRFALTVLPSPAALRALREVARPSRAREPFIGFGDPVLTGPPGAVRGITVAALYTRGGVDVRRVRELPPLPETAAELLAVARSLGSDERALFLRERATVAQLRAIDLARYRVIAFATHGLTSGEIEGAIEPGLVLTPPARDGGDSGILAASDIAALRLDAEWVILSACNTAAADGTPGADALSGLARAFFHAGTRAILVSHWAVASEAAARLTTGLFEAAAADAAIGRAEALRRSILRMIETPGEPHLAHPLFWAPFVVVGEGGVRL